MLSEQGHLLRIFVGESKKHQGMPLYEWIIRAAKEHGLAGATVLRGILGYGSSKQIHSAKILALSTDLPVIIEIIDELDKIESFLPVIDSAIEVGLATVEKAQIRFYRSKSN